MVVHLDTTFLVDILRTTDGPATAFLNGLGDREVAMSVHAACELHAGAELALNPAEERARVTALCAAIRVAHATDEFAPTYGRLFAELRKRGQAVPAMDLLIATAAVVEEAPIVTRNARDFERIPGLHVMTY